MITAMTSRWLPTQGRVGDFEWEFIPYRPRRATEAERKGQKIHRSTSSYLMRAG